MEKLLINTPQNVNIEYGLASIGSRILSFGIDYAIIIGYIYLVTELLGNLLKNINDYWLQIGLWSLLLLPVFFYHLFFETIMGGQTIGKKVMRIKVVKIDGTRASLYEYFIRWALSTIDLWLAGGVIGLTSVILSKKSQRIGDIAADTTVINLKPKMSLLETTFEVLEEQHQITFPQVLNLSDKDINIIKENLQLAQKKQDVELLLTLANKIKNVLNIHHTKLSDEAFIQTILQDHYHQFKK